MKNTFFQGKTFLFEDPNTSKGPFSTMDISNVKEDLTGYKHWVTIGLRTYSGMALETFNAPNGQLVFPRVAAPRPIVRVPAVLYPPWVEAELPQDTSESNMTCLKRGYQCYNKTDAGVVKLCCFGFSIDLLRTLERELGFVPEIYFVSDGQYGIVDKETGKWNGIVNELVSGRGDLALDLALTEKRTKDISYSFPYLPLALNILVKKDGPLKNGEKLLYHSCSMLNNFRANVFEPTDYEHSLFPSLVRRVSEKKSPPSSSKQGVLAAAILKPTTFTG